MDSYFSKIFKSFFIAIILLIFGCASIPKEVVELSYSIGEDLNSIHVSYRMLIQEHFENLRSQRIDFLKNRLIPVFLEKFIDKGELVTTVQGSDPVEVLEGVQDWVEVAIETIEEKKRELIDPIDGSEKQLLELVDEEFSRIIRANAAITAHLNSIRKVQSVQDEALRALKIKELRDTINEELIAASIKADEALERVKKAEGIIGEKLCLAMMDEFRKPLLTDFSFLIGFESQAIEPL